MIKKEKVVGNKPKKKKLISDKQRKSVWTFFTLLFPSLLLTLLLSFSRTIEFNILGILLFFYQAILLKNFIEKHYDAFQ